MTQEISLLGIYPNKVKIQFDKNPLNPHVVLCPGTLSLFSYFLWGLLNDIIHNLLSESDSIVLQEVNR